MKHCKSEIETGNCAQRNIEGKRKIEVHHLILHCYVCSTKSAPLEKMYTFKKILEFSKIFGLDFKIGQLF